MSSNNGSRNFRKYPPEMRERAVRMVAETIAEQGLLAAVRWRGTDRDGVLRHELHPGQQHERELELRGHLAPRQPSGEAAQLGHLPLLHSAVSHSDVVDRTEILDAWVDAARGTRIFLHPLVGAGRGRGFVASARDVDGTVVAERLFMLTDGGVEALPPHEAQRTVRRQASRWRRLLAGVLGTALAACSIASDPPAGCSAIAPAELPSGGEAGEPVTVETSPRQTVAWGTGNDRITQAVGWFGLGSDEDFPPTDGLATSIRETEGYLQTTEELPHGIAAVSWEEAGCLYTIWLEPGYSNDQVLEYAGRY